MKKDIEVTKMIFRVDTSAEFKGIVFAIMPYVIECDNSVSYYTHIGQHGGCDYQWAIKISRPATEAEYKDLFNELTSNYGYNIEVIKKINQKQFIQAYRTSKQLV